MFGTQTRLHVRRMILRKVALDAAKAANQAQLGSEPHSLGLCAAHERRRFVAKRTCNGGVVSRALHDSLLQVSRQHSLL